MVPLFALAEEPIVKSVSGVVSERA